MSIFGVVRDQLISIRHAGRRHVVRPGKATSFDARCESDVRQSLWLTGLIALPLAVALLLAVVGLLTWPTGQVALAAAPNCADNSWSVANESELNAAIDCYNAKTVAGSYPITVTDDIDLTASTTTISNTTSGVSLVLAGSNHAVDGQATAGVRPFLIAASTTVTMNDLTVTGGKLTGPERGGGIRNLGKLTINRSTIQQNTAEINGGGISNGPGAVMVINDSTISGNEVQGGSAGVTGGGITNDGSLTIRNSTISGNTSSNDGGGIGNSGTLNLDSVTVTGNTASGASLGAIGAGVYSGGFGSLATRNSILAGNLGAEDCYTFLSITDGGHNLVQTQANCGFTNGVNGNIVGSDPLLGPLADNGGDTETHALLGGSPAIDTGATSLTTDQRGVTRPQFVADDIGAYESVCGTATGWTAATQLELDTAIGCFNKQTVAGSYTITVTGNISLTSSIAAIDNPTSGPSLVIVGGDYTIDGGDAPGNPGAGGFVIDSPTAVSITDLTVTRSRQLLTGGAIRNPNGGALTLDNVTLTQNRAGFGGGALSSNGPVTITNSLISDNDNPAGKGGGGILIESPGSLTLIDSEVSDNTTAVFGGGISAESGANLTITRSLIAGNTAGVEGGGIFNDGSLTIDQSTVSGNTASDTGGGVANGGGSTVFIRNSTISGNSATGTGGGLIVGDRNTLDSVTVANNTSGSYGAGVFPKGTGVITMTNSILGDNTSTGYAAGSGVVDCGSIGGGHTWVENHNLVEDGDNCGFANGVNNTITGVDPALGPLADNGGDTETHALLGGSPAIDAGDTSLTTDQRGVTRPQGAADDMGAFESQVGTITIVKDADPADDTPFDFTITGGISDTFTLSDPSVISTTFSALTSGDYQVTELLPAGWELAYIDCQHAPNSFVGINYGENRAYITLAPGDDVTCTFNNKLRLGSLTVVKNAVGGDGAFPFTSPSLGAFTVTTASGAGRQVFPNLLPGAYSLSESVPAGWRLDSAVCSDGSPVNAVQVDPGEDVVCTFTDTRLDTIVVVKRAVGGDGSFAFSSPQLGAFNLKTVKGEQTVNFANLAPGSYSIAETAQPGWTPTVADPVCSNGDNASNITLAAGQTVVCVFVNLKQDTLVVEQRTIGGDGSFAFASPQLGAFSLSTTGGAASRSFPSLQPGTYAISPTIPTGWVQSGATCSDGSSPTSLSLAPGENVTCTFTTTRLSSITVVKQATGSDGTFAFTGDLGGFSLTTAGGTAQRVFADLAAGTYTLSETVRAGWDLTGATCSDGSDPASIDLAAGENVTCTFANTQQGRLTVVKNTTGGDGAFAFTSQTLGGFTLTTSSGTAQRSFANLVPGTYDVAETIPTGWRQDGATCSNGSSPASVRVGPGEDVTCTFANTKLDTLTIIKLAVGSDTTFGFTSTITGSPAFSLTTTGGAAQQSFSNLAPGTYAVVETPLAGWTQAEADPVCSNGDRASAIRLGAGESVTCLFLNLQQDTIVVEKRTVGGDGTFRFTSDIPGASTFSLTSSGGVTRTVFSGLTAGTYAISETVPVGWDLTSATCDNGQTPANLQVGSGQTVTCTFANTQRASLTIVKQTTGGDGSFAFTGDLGAFTLNTSNGTAQQRFANLTPGTYAVAETAQAGWDLGSATCSNGSNPASLSLAPGEDVTCTFANTRRGSLTVVKQAQGGEGSFAFTSQALGDFSLTTRNGTAQRVFANLTPGRYDLSETVPTGWDLTGATCTDGSNPASVSIGAGEQVTCTFVNTRRGGLTVVKQTQGGEGSFAFTGDLGAFTLTTAGGTAQRSFANLVPGVYRVAETVPTGWQLDGATCSDGSDPNSINLTAGEQVTCTFTNTKRGSLTVVKQATGGDETFVFSSQTLTPTTFSLVTTGGTARRSFANLTPGTYDVSETVPTGWQLDGATCSDGSDPASIALGPGEDVTCTFTNTRQDTITIIKRAVGGDGTFAFGSPQVGAFSLTTQNGTQQRSFANLAPGSYAITETVPVGWTAQEADPVCSNGERASSLTLGAGESITCVFVNLKQDTLVVEQRTVGGDGSFAFASPQLGAFSLSTTGGAASRSFPSLQPGTYAISPTIPTGWVQSGATCSDGSSPSSVSLAPGENVTCTFTTTRLSNLTVIQRTIGGDANFTFTGDLGSFSLKTANGLAKRSFRDLSAGTYAISETVPSGWDLTSATCSDGSRPDAITLDPGEQTTCTFVNTKRASLTVVKQATGSDATFTFNSTTLTPDTFTLATSGGAAQRSFADLAPGTYDLSEAPLAGWRQDGVTCSNGSPATAISLSPGKQVTCTVASTQLDTITVIKRTVGGEGSFTFTSTGLTPSSFSLTTSNGTAQRSFANLAPGTYALTETVPVGWTAQETDPVCSNGQQASSLTLGAGESITCVFANRKNDTVIVEQRTIGGDATFAFASTLPGASSFALTTSNNITRTSLTNLPAGTYAITPTMPLGWDLTSATCDNGSSPANLVLSPGETVTCAFEATQRASLTVLKQATGGDGTFAFTSQVLGSFAITTTGGTGQQVFANLVPGGYDVSEVLTGNWQLTSAICDNGDTPDSINLSAGSTVTCTFANTQSQRIFSIFVPFAALPTEQKANAVYLPFISPSERNWPERLR